MVLKAWASSPSVLLLNDKYDAHWSVTVDGQPAELLRCNFLMRGVHLEAGEHEVVFTFRPPQKTLYISLVAILAGLGLCGWVGWNSRRDN